MDPTLTSHNSGRQPDLFGAGTAEAPTRVSAAGTVAADAVCGTVSTPATTATSPIAARTSRHHQERGRVCMRLIIAAAGPARQVSLLVLMSAMMTPNLRSWAWIRLVASCASLGFQTGQHVSDRGAQVEATRPSRAGHQRIEPVHQGPVQPG